MSHLYAPILKSPNMDGSSHSATKSVWLGLWLCPLLSLSCVMPNSTGAVSTAEESLEEDLVPAKVPSALVAPIFVILAATITTSNTIILTPPMGPSISSYISR